MGRTRAVIFSLGIMFIMLSVFMIATIHEFLPGESKEFNELNEFIVKHAFQKNWVHVMKLVQEVSSYSVLFIILAATVIWVILKNQDYLLEIKVILLTDLGAFVFEKILRLIFHQQGPLGMITNKVIIYTFPSGDVLLSVVVYGFFAYVVSLRTNRMRIKTILMTILTVILSMIGLSTIYLNLAYPNDVIAAYLFGGIWLMLNIILLEVFRILPAINSERNI
jgi:membrane-associated phospholipid phosphatase